MFVYIMWLTSILIICIYITFLDFCLWKCKLIRKSTPNLRLKKSIDVSFLSTKTNKNHLWEFQIHVPTQLIECVRLVFFFLLFLLIKQCQSIIMIYRFFHWISLNAFVWSVHFLLKISPFFCKTMPIIWFTGSSIGSPTKSGFKGSLLLSSSSYA